MCSLKDFMIKVDANDVVAFFLSVPTAYFGAKRLILYKAVGATTGFNSKNLFLTLDNISYDIDSLAIKVFILALAVAFALTLISWWIRRIVYDSVGSLDAFVNRNTKYVFIVFIMYIISILSGYIFKIELLYAVPYLVLMFLLICVLFDTRAVVRYSIFFVLSIFLLSILVTHGIDDYDGSEIEPDKIIVDTINGKVVVGNVHAVTSQDVILNIGQDELVPLIIPRSQIQMIRLVPESNATSSAEVEEIAPGTQPVESGP